MPKQPRRVRFPIFMDVSLLRRVEALVAEFGYSRSAVVRAAVERGLASASRDLRASHAARMRDTSGLFAGGGEILR